MSKWKNVKITIQQSDGKSFEVERPINNEGSVCFEGAWLKPEEVDGKLVIKKTVLNHPKASSSSRVRLSAAMIAMSMLSQG